MSDAPDPRPTDSAPDLRHLELLDAEIARHRQNSFRTRVASLALVAGFIAWHAQHTQPRYMFLAPVLALGAWTLDAAAGWHEQGLRLAVLSVLGAPGPRALPRSVDIAPFTAKMSVRRALLQPSRALWFLPLVACAGAVAADAPLFDAQSVPSQLFWYLAVAFLSFLGLVAVAGSWWYDQFADPAVRAPFIPTKPAALSPAPEALARNGEGPFPVTAKRNDPTHPFGTAVG